MEYLMKVTYRLGKIQTSITEYHTLAELEHMDGVIHLFFKAPCVSLKDVILPRNLIELYCFGIGLKELPEELPATLKTLECQHNLITQIPTLPDTLKNFHANGNPLPDDYVLWHNMKYPNMKITEVKDV